MVFLLVPTGAFAQTEPVIETITGLRIVPPTGEIETFTFDKIQYGYTWELDEDGFLYKAWDADRLESGTGDRPEYPKVTEKYTITQIDEDTFSYSTHAPYVAYKQEWKPYVLNENDSVVKVKVSGSDFVFDKVQGAVTIFNDQGVVIDSDSYVVRTALVNSDVWDNLTVNDEIVTTTVTELDDTVTVSFIRENVEGKFTTEYIIGDGDVKTTAYFTNYTFENNKFAFTQTLNLPDSIISLNGMEDIDLTNYVGQSFPREVLEQNEDLILSIKDMYYNSGLGFENLWSVNVTSPTKVSLDYANVSQTQTNIGETVELDPTWSYGGLSWGDRYFIYSVSGVASTTCVAPWAVYLGNAANYLTFPSSGTTSSNCYLPVNQFNISTLPTTATITGVSMSYDIFNSSLPRNCDFVAIDATRTTANATNVINEITNNTVMLSNDSACASGIGSYTANFGSAGVTELTNDMNNGNSHFVVGIKPSVGIIRDGNTHQQIAQNQKLHVTYTSPPTTPTNVTATFNDPNVDMTWTASNNYSPYIVSSDAYTGSNPTNYGATTGATGKIGNAWDFDGVNDYVRDATVHFPTGRATSVWVDIQLKNYGTIVGGINYGSIQTYANGDMYSYGGNNAGALTSNTWYHIVSTVDSTKAEQTYVNGVLVGTGTLGYHMGTPQPYVIGATGGGNFPNTAPYNFLDGSVDELIIYNRPLTSSEVATLYNSGSGNTPDSISTSGLTHYYNFEQTGSTLTNMAVVTDPVTVTYNVIRDSSTIATTTGTTYQDSPTLGSIYNYALSSATTYGTSPTSASISVDTSPDPPTGLSATINAPNVDLSWTAPSGSVTGYKIETSVDGVTWSNVIVNTATTSTTYSHTSPTPNTVNHYRVFTINNGVNSTTSTSTTISVGGVTDAPTGLTATFNAPNVDLSWSTPANNNGSVITGYKIETSTDQTNWNIVTSNTGNVNTTYPHTTPTLGSLNYYKVSAINAYGLSPVSNVSNVLAGTPPDAPTGVTTVISDPNTTPLDITVNWSSPSNVGSGTLTGFEIYRDGSLITTTGLVTTYTDTVPNSGTFVYSMKAVSDHGTSILSNTASQTTASVPSSDSSVTLLINNPNPSPFDVTVSFVAPTNNGGSNVTGYNLYSSPDDITYTLVASAVTADQTITVSGVGTHYFKSEAINLIGTATQGIAVSIATPNTPDTPTLTLAIPDPNGFPFDTTASFVAPANNGGSNVTGYNLYYSSDDVTYTSIAVASNAVIPHTVGSAGTHYFKAEAISNAGTGALSSAFTIDTPTVPSAPLNATSDILALNTTPYNVTVSWNTPTTNGGSNLTGYDVYRKQGSASPIFITNTTALTLVDTVPSVLNTNFTYQIYAVNNVGQSQFVDTTITTRNVATAPVLSFTTGTTSISWTAPSSDATITSYNIFRDSILLTNVSTLTHTDWTLITFGQSYTYDVQAVSILGVGTMSNSIVILPETEITGMGSTGITGKGAVIDWDAPAYYQGNLTYNVWYVTPSITTGTPTTSAGTTTNTFINFAPQLDYDTSYTFGVTITSPLGNSGFSNLVTLTTNVDGGIVTFDPTVGANWFDIDAVNEDDLNVIKFERSAVMSGADLVTQVQVAYPVWWDQMTCDLDYKFAQITTQHVEGTDMTAVLNPNNTDQQVIGFAFYDVNNEVVEIQCAPQLSDVGDASSGTFILTQQGVTFDAITGDSINVPNIPIVTQITNFQSGTYGTEGDFGALDIVGLFAILISMMGFNRLSPIVGVILSASVIFGLAFFGIITVPSIIIGVIALVIFMAWGVNRQR